MKTPSVRNARLQYKTATIEIAADRNPRVVVDYLQGTTR
jgi:hypothetical protein